MSQKSQSDDGQKHFAVGRGLLAAAETLNFNMKEQHHGRQMGGMSSGMGVGGGGGGGMDSPSTKSQMARCGGGGGGGNLGSTMKLFASLGLSPSDLDALAELPEEDISVETLPRILMQLKSRKGDSSERRAASMSSDSAYRGGRDSWDDGQVGRMGGASLGQGSSRAQASSDFGYNSLQDVSSGRSYGLNYGGGGGGGGADGSRDRSYSGLSHQDSYGGLGMRPSQSDSVFMQRRIGSPSNGKIQDFLGVMPAMFPRVCSLCDFDVHSSMEWNQHTSGLLHAENRRLLLDMYPDWDPGMSSGRGDGLLDTPNLSAGLLGPAPMSSGGTGGMSSSWGGGGPGLSGKNQSGQNKLRSRVVVVKYDRKPLSNKTLFAFTKQFGVLREHLVLKTKAFLEMSSHEEALNMVNYYEQHTASLYGKPLNFYLSQTLMVIEKDKRTSDRSLDRGMDRPLKSHDSKVVFFSNLPREDEDKEELLTIAGRFGTVDKHLFLTDQAFVQLGTVEDAEMLVKYYSVNPLTIKGRFIRLNICAKYKTLNVKPKQGQSGGDQRGNRGNTSSPRGRTSSASSNWGGGKTSSTARSTSTSRTREEKKEEEREKEEKAAGRAKEAEEEEEVSGVMQGGEEEEDDEVPDDDSEEEEPERAESEKESEEVQQEEQVPDDASGDEGGAKDKAKQGAEPEETEAEASTEQQERKDKAAERSEAAEGDDLDADDAFMDNMEDFVTLDELQEDEEEAESKAIDNTKRGGRRVVNILDFRRGHNFLEEMLGLAKPFGKVIRHLVLDVRPEAFLEFATEEEARAMTKFYNSNVTALVCGRPVRIYHSISYLTIQCGPSRVVYIGQIPNCKYTDQDILKLAEPYGRVHKYLLNRIRRECFLEMETPEDAEKMADAYKANPQRFNGKRLTVYMSRKYRQLKHGYLYPTAPKREKSRTPPRSSSEEPPAKKLKEEEPEEEQEEEEKREEKQQQEEVKVKEEAQSCDVTAATAKETTAEQSADVCEEKRSSEELPEVKQEQMETNQNGQAEAPPPAPAAEPKNSAASLPLPPYDPDNAIGVEFVKMGYYCRVCFLFYSNEETAKKTHCSSQAHYDKLQKYLEKEQNKAEKKKQKKAAA